jgi:hypothetical protein
MINDYLGDKVAIDERLIVVVATLQTIKRPNY